MSPSILIQGRNAGSESAPLLSPGSYVFFGGDKKNHMVIRAVLLMGENQKKLRKISFLPDLHSQVKSTVSSGEFKRIVTIFPDYQLFWRLEGIRSANTIL